MDDELLTIDDLAKLLKLSKRSVYEMTRARTRARMLERGEKVLPMVRLNSHTRFLRSAVNKWVQESQVEAA